MSYFYALAILVAVFPLGAAGQNIGAGIVGLWLLYLWRQNRSDSSPLPIPLKKISYLAAFFVASLLFSTVIYSPESFGRGLSFVGGYLGLVLFPVVFAKGSKNLDLSRGRFLLKVVVIVSVIWALIALSQVVWGWQLQDLSLGEATKRARGLYSHPLSFAYAVLLLWPAATLMWLSRPSSLLNILFFLSIGVSLFASQSRTVELVAGGLLLGNIFLLLSGRRRQIFLTLAVLGLVVVGITPNPVSQKFRATLAGEEDRQSAYADDRLAFWQAHWHLFLERPLLGFGVAMTEDRRAQAYQETGLGDFSKKYTAHNMFLQILVEGGIIGFALFLAWYCRHFVVAYQNRRISLWHEAFWQTLIVFSLASVTQNALQDTEVRFGLTILFSAFWLFTSGSIKRTQGNATSNR